MRQSHKSYPPHLGRRGSVFFVRFRIPADLNPVIGVQDIKRSLKTSDLDEAKLLCSQATFWFQKIVARLRVMKNPNKHDLEKAAQKYFDRLKSEVDKPRDIPTENWDQELSFQIEQTQEQIAMLKAELIANSFDKAMASGKIATSLEISLDQLSSELQRYALQLIAKAELEQMNYLLHSLEQPAAMFEPANTLFSSQQHVISSSSGTIQNQSLAHPQLKLAIATASFLDQLKSKNLGSGRIDETARVLNWLCQTVDPEIPVEAISINEMRSFRENLKALRHGHRGTDVAFIKRIAKSDAPLLGAETRQKYWRSVSEFFRWLKSDYGVQNVIEGMNFDIAKTKKQIRGPFQPKEVDVLLSSPLYTGYLSPNRLHKVGNVKRRNSQWWSGIFMLAFGMRAGDIAQLLTTDFDFKSSIPSLTIQPGLLPEGMPKQSKFGDRTHALPIPKALIELGLQEFIQSNVGNQKRRVFHQFRFGEKRKSTGLSRFWSDHLKYISLYKSGRGAHTFRHTVAADLREQGVSDYDIGLVLGHKTSEISESAITADYGPSPLLKRKLEIISKLSYLGDLVDRLGGPYDPTKH